MKQPVSIYLDLDRTLLDTDAIMVAVFAQCQRLYGIPQTTLRPEMPRFYHSVGSLHYYDFFGHIASHNLDPAQVARDLLAAIDQDFIYPDAHRMLHYLTGGSYRLHILSFGKHDFQQFKYRLAPQLGGIPFTSLLYPKNHYLSGASNTPTLLVDDVLTPDLPPHAWQVHIDRTVPQDIEQLDSQHIRVRSLQSVERLLRVGYNGVESKRKDE